MSGLRPDPAEQTLAEDSRECGFAVQLDLFRDSPREIAAHSARNALAAGDARRACEHLAALAGDLAGAEFVADCRSCLELIERRDPRWRDLAAAVEWLEAELWPAARRCLGPRAPLVVRPALLSLLDHDPASLRGQPRQRHPAHLWQLLGDHGQAVAAIERDPHWRQDPLALLWHAELCELASFPARLHADVVELCLSWPEQADAWLSHSQALAEPWSSFCELDDPPPLQHFPAFARLLHACDLPLPPAGDQRPGTDLLRLADRLLRDPGDLDLRRRLRELSPALLAAFLRTRSGKG